LCELTTAPLLLLGGKHLGQKVGALFVRHQPPERAHQHPGKVGGIEGAILSVEGDVVVLEVLQDARRHRHALAAQPGEVPCNDSFY